MVLLIPLSVSPHDMLPVAPIVVMRSMALAVEVRRASHCLLIRVVLLLLTHVLLGQGHGSLVTISRLLLLLLLLLHIQLLRHRCGVSIGSVVIAIIITLE